MYNGLQWLVAEVGVEVVDGVFAHHGQVGMEIVEDFGNAVAVKIDIAVFELLAQVGNEGIGIFLTFLLQFVLDFRGCADTVMLDGFDIDIATIDAHLFEGDVFHRLVFGMGRGRRLVLRLLNGVVQVLVKHQFRYEAMIECCSFHNRFFVLPVHLWGSC